MGAHFEYGDTDKQREIIRHVLNETDTGQYITVRDLQAKLSYGAGVNKQAILCSLRHLRNWGFIRLIPRGPKSAFVAPTAKAFARYRTAPVTA